MTDSRPIGFWLRLVDRLIEERFDALLEEHGVTRRQWQLLNILERGPASADQLDAAVAPFLDDDGSESSVAHLAELVESGWVVEGFALTDTGRTAFDGLRVVVGEMRQSAAEGVSEGEYAATIDVLERMAHNLGWNPTPEDPQGSMLS
jgi:DNA-binding MarR family transcriptional regulator